ncbi:hypothetical protein ENSA7_07770 [Enhygromyxa salina]|uniref:Uncharacterized protein n=2 Tax=Enhygromyxa salina TaxID=215803 RepID=A0A2S9YWQ0_9BACT|nr:hypothetical protein ENSA7_07770 [Enhygromyxa salina]
MMAGCAAATLGACRPESSAPVADPTTAAVAVSRAEIHRIEAGLEIRYVLAVPCTSTPPLPGVLRLTKAPDLALTP